MENARGDVVRAGSVAHALGPAVRRSRVAARPRAAGGGARARPRVRAAPDRPAHPPRPAHGDVRARRRRLARSASSSSAARRPGASGRVRSRLDERSARRCGATPAAQCVVPIGAIAAVLPGRPQLEASLEPQPESTARLAERIGTRVRAPRPLPPRASGSRSPPSTDATTARSTASRATTSTSRCTSRVRPRRNATCAATASCRSSGSCSSRSADPARRATGRAQAGRRVHARELDDVGELALVPRRVPAGRLVLLIDPDLELRALDAPGPAFADADRRQLARADQLVDGRDVDGEHLRRVGDGEEAADRVARTVLGHHSIIGPADRAGLRCG